MNVDDGYAAAGSLFADVKTRIESIRSEEDAKLQIITRVLTEILGWSHSDMQSERPNENGFSDYLITDGDHKALLVEAKKIGEITLATASQKRAFLKISGPVLSPASEAKLHNDTLAGVRGTVESFDQTRGFGFVSVPALRDTAFLHASVLERDGFDEVFDGDDLICDVSRNEKGFVVSQVIELNQTQAPTVSAVVVKLFDERRYGFVHVEETGVDAFFHYHLLTGPQKRDLFEGQELLVEVVTDKGGRSQVRRIVG